MQANPDNNKKDPLFYIVPPLIVASLLLFVWTAKSPSATPANKGKVAAVAAPEPAKTEQPAPVETPAATDTEPGTDSSAVAVETPDDTADGEQDVPSLLDDDAVGEEIEEIPADTSDDEEEEEEEDDDATPEDDAPAEE